MRDVINTSDARSFVKGYQTLLTAEEEKTLFGDWHATNPELYQRFLDPDDEEVKAFYSPEDDKYLTRVVLAYGPIIRRAMKELSGYRMSEDEMLSEGLVGLIEAARRFNPEKARFATYAKQWCKGVMWGFITKNFFLTSVCTSHSKKKLFFAMRTLIAITLVETGTFTLTSEVTKKLAEEYKTSESEVQIMYDMFHRPYESLSDPVREVESGEVTRGDTIVGGADSMELVIDDDIIKFHKRIVHEAMDRVLTPREKRIFMAQELSEDRDDSVTLEALGVEYDVSKERVRQLRISAMKKITAEIHRVVENDIGIKPEDMFA